MGGRFRAMKSPKLLFLLLCMAVFFVASASQASAQSSPLNVLPPKLSFQSEQLLAIWGGNASVQRTIILENNNTYDISNVTMQSTTWYEINSSQKISTDEIHFDEVTFSIPAGSFHEVTLTVDVSNLKTGTYSGYILISINHSTTQQVDATLTLTKNEIPPLLVGFVVLGLIMLSFWLLLQRNPQDKKTWPKTRLGGEAQRLGISFIIIVVALVLVITVVPFGQALNPVLVTALFTPFIAYIISVLKAENDFSKQIDLASQDYRKRMIEIESNTIGGLVGELTTHSAALTSEDWPRPCELQTIVWEKSEKMGLISEMHSLSLAKYYRYVPLYNSCIKKLPELVDKGKSPQKDELKNELKNCKEAMAKAETLLYQMLIYDLGLLQQKYLRREPVSFPYHATETLKKTLQTYRILGEANKDFNSSVYDKAAKFNKEIGFQFKGAYEVLEKNLNSLLDDIKNRIAAQKKPEKEDYST